MTGKEYLEKVSKLMLTYGLLDNELAYVPDLEFKMPAKNGITRKIGICLNSECIVKLESQTIDISEQIRRNNTAKK